MIIEASFRLFVCLFDFFFLCLFECRGVLVKLKIVGKPFVFFVILMLFIPRPRVFFIEDACHDRGYTFFLAIFFILNDGAP